VNIRSIMKTIATISEAVAALLLLYLCGCGSANDCELGIVPNLQYIARLRKRDVSVSPTSRDSIVGIPVRWPQVS